MNQREDINDHIYNFGCTDCGFRLVDKTGARPGSCVVVPRIIEALDACFARNDMDAAGRLLDYWRKEAVALRDKEGELSIVNEQLGYYRKIGHAAKGQEAVARSLALLEDLQLYAQVSGATILLNAATTLKAFGQPEKALVLYDKVYDIYRKSLTQDDPLMAGYYNNRGVALCDLHKYLDALCCFRLALPTVNGTPDAAVTYINMAHMYDDWQHDLSDGEDCLRYAVQIDDCLRKAEVTLSSSEYPWDGYYAYVCSKCAPSFDYFGYFACAQELRERAKNIYEGS